MAAEFQLYLEFLEFYLHGILHEGTIVPLRNFSARRSDLLGEDVDLLFKLQLEGKSPQESFCDHRLKMPQALKDTFILGFEKSVIDLVLADTVNILKQKKTSSDIELNLQEIIKKYSKVDVDSICVGCANIEMEKIFSRAQIEGAKEVIIEQDGDFMVQKYLGTKLTVVREAAIPAVYESLKSGLQSHKNKVQIQFR